MKIKNTGQKSPGQMVLYASNGSLVKRIIEEKEYNFDKSFETRNPLFNRFGFFAALVNGFISDGNNKMEINFHEKIDLSLIQKGGFTMFFWFLAKKQPQGSIRYILKQGNTSEEITPSIGFLPNCVNLFVKILSSKNRQETLYSSKTIEANKLYSLAITFSIDYENDLTDILLYLDGILDSQISIPGEPLHNQGKMHLGKVDKNNLGFIGYLADIMVAPRVLNEIEIGQISKACLINLMNNANNYNQCLIKSYEIFERKFERDKLLEKYSQHTGSPMNILENLDLLNDELRDIVKKFDENFFEENNDSALENNYNNNNNINNINRYQNENMVRFRDIAISLDDHKMVQKLQSFLEEDEADKSIFFRKCAMNAGFIYSIFYLASEDQKNLTPQRIIIMLEILKETLHMKIEEKDLIVLAKILKSYESGNININTFLNSIAYFTKILYPDLNLNMFANNHIQKNMNNMSYNYSTNNFYSATGNNFAYNSSMLNYYDINNNNLENLNSVEMHENFLLRSSQKFHDDEDEFEKDIGKSTFSIKTLYSRPKTGRPMTSTRGFGNNVNNDINENFEGEDYVNQNFDDIQEIDNQKQILNEKFEKESNDNDYNKDVKIEQYNNVQVQTPEGNIENFKADKAFDNAEDRDLQEKNKHPQNQENEIKHKDSITEKYNENAFDSATEANIEKSKSRKANQNQSNSNFIDDEHFSEIQKEYSEPNDSDKLKSTKNLNTQKNNQISTQEKLNENKNHNNNNHKDLNTDENKVHIKEEQMIRQNTKISNERQNAESSKNIITQDKYNSNKNINKEEKSEVVNDLNTKIIGKNFEETKNQFSDPENIIPIKTNKMIDNNIQVDGNKIEEEYKDEIRNDNMEDNQDNISVVELEAKYPDDWNMGSIELIINHCIDCHKHKKTTRHYEYTYVDKFNEIGQAIKEVFPNIIIIGNFDKIDHLGCFDVYIRGIGPHLDDKGRYYLFSKRVSRKFPTKNDVIDKLVTLSLLYGSSTNIEAAQLQYIKAYESFLPKQNKDSHEHPINLSEEGEKAKASLNPEEKKKPQIDPDRTKFSCINFGCGHTFTQSENHPKACSYHPGIWQFGSYNAYWPEAWSCCERGWNEEGCRRGSHKGVRLENRVNLCLNFGALNPITNHPDSACGTYYSTSNNSECKYHPGYFKRKTGNWSCCEMGDINADGCIQGKHATFFWPDEKAKLYFYPKYNNNPGLMKSSKGKLTAELPSLGYQICKCDFFKPIKQYENTATKFELLKIKRDKEKDELKICFRWTCEKTYKDSLNTEKSCLCHPGKWDHGSTGTKMADFISEFLLDPKNVEKKTILWRPHWSCCGGEWDKKGCTLMRHNGPLVSEADKYNRKYRWPDIRAKLNFPKVVSNKWKQNLQKYTFSEDKVKLICAKFFSSSKRYVSDLPSLCDNLKLYLLVVNDKIDYQLKFMDIVTQSNSIAFFSDNNGCIEPGKFLRWWFEDYEIIINSILEKEKK